MYNMSTLLWTPLYKKGLQECRHVTHVVNAHLFAKKVMDENHVAALLCQSINRRRTFKYSAHFDVFWCKCAQVTSVPWHWDSLKSNRIEQHHHHDALIIYRTRNRTLLETRHLLLECNLWLIACFLSYSLIYTLNGLTDMRKKKRINKSMLLAIDYSALIWSLYARCQRRAE